MNPSNANGPSVQQQNSRGQWVPAIPLPFFSFRKVRCECGRNFKNDELYRGHYALIHILGLK